MKKTAWTLGALMLLPASTAFALGPVDLELELVGWQSSLSGETRSGGGNIDLKNELGLDDKSVGFLRGRAHVTFLGNLYVGVTPLKYDASKTLTLPLTYADKNLSGAVTTNIDLKTYDLGWTFSPLNLGILEAEIGANIKFIDGNITIKDNTQTAQTDFSAPVPMLKAVVRVSGPFVVAEVDGMAIAYADNHLYDVTAQVKLNPFPFMYVAGGYRYIDLELTDGGKLASMINKGPFLGIGIDF